MKERGVFVEKSNWNILKLLKIRASEYGDKEFIRFDCGTSLSFKLLDEQSDKFAYKLLDIGLKEDENVFCFLKNTPEFLISIFAVMKVGAIFVPINTELRRQFLENFKWKSRKIKIPVRSIGNVFLYVFIKKSNRALLEPIYNETIITTSKKNDFLI